VVKQARELAQKKRDEAGGQASQGTMTTVQQQGRWQQPQQQRPQQPRLPLPPSSPHAGNVFMAHMQVQPDGSVVQLPQFPQHGNQQLQLGWNGGYGN
jgi:hypothetical protein